MGLFDILWDVGFNIGNAIDDLKLNAEIAVDNVLGVSPTSNSDFNNDKSKPVVSVHEDNKITKQENNNLHRSESKIVSFDANGIWAKERYRYAAYLFNVKTDISEWYDVLENGLLMFAANKYTHIVFCAFPKGVKNAWDNVVYQTVDITLPALSSIKFILTRRDTNNTTKFVGIWSEQYFSGTSIVNNSVDLGTTIKGEDDMKDKQKSKMQSNTDNKQIEVIRREKFEKLITMARNYIEPKQQRTAVDKLADYVEAARPIIYINHFDSNMVDGVIGKINPEAKIVEFKNALGAVDFKTQRPFDNQQASLHLEGFLQSVKDEGYDKETYIVLHDIQEELREPRKNAKVIALLKYIAEKILYNEAFAGAIFIVSSQVVIPPELENYITLFDIPLPTDEEIQQIILDFCIEKEIKPASGVVDELTLSLKGMNEFQIRQILNLAYHNGGDLNSDDNKMVLEEKQQFIKKAGMLEIVNFNESITDIGGLDNLKKWLRDKAKIFKDLDRAIKYGVDVPKGVMIVGMPGCGKSMTAKATASLFQIPLVRLDIGRLLGKYVGESEANMRQALQLAEAISPCVLWIDEIEKAFSGINSAGSGNEVTTRLFGQFLTWMQEKENTVFIVATANDISNIPAEFLRKGRFDELFFVDLPNNQERLNILEIQLQKRHKFNSDINISALASETEGYSGADLEAIVKDAIEKAFIKGKARLTTEDVMAAKKQIKSISDTLKSKIEDIRKTVENMDIKQASK